MYPGILAFIAAFIAAACAAPIVARSALALGIVDQPDGHRKLHVRPVPLVGGPTILLSLFVALGIALWSFPDALRSTDNDRQFLICLTLASVVIVLIGLIDDRFGIRGRQKLAGQFLAAILLLPSGIVVRETSLFGTTFVFGDLAPIVTVLFIVGAINALNLIDGVDGLASTTGIVLSLSIAAVTWICGGRPDGLIMSTALAGSLAGFLIYNFPPARMFLGDSGSMLIGLILGAVALKCSIRQYAAATLIMPTAIWAIPIFDVAMAIVRRKLTGRSIYETDHGHLHHCLQRKGYVGWRLLLLTGLLCALTGVGAVAGSVWKNDLIAVVGVMTALLLLILTRSFGHTEMMMLSSRARRLAGSLIRRSSPAATVLHDEKVRLTGDHDWQQLWQTLTAYGERFSLDSMDLNVNLPIVGEGYHASWKRKSETERHQEWRSEIPLTVDGLRIGHLRIVGAAGDDSVFRAMSELIGGLQAFENELADVVRDIRRRRLGVESVTPISEAESAADLSDSQQFVLG
ncbi:MAG: undecaprenyl/decaprenyl-phosphate alpha-N-acetylglucosaminyl 1-phosphate transferase [Planctomycetaceae bacterium]|nr:undecaprenyl/decaprenyl-phosphate alpha-N-acetylglucosaminyl 1-phosphate transferase [Planctomycetaceae bacterium]